MPEYMKAWDIEALPRSLDAGTFTPFLGAGASSLRSRQALSFDAPPWSDVGKTLERIYIDVAGKESRGFLRAFARQRLRMTKPQLDQFMPEKLEADIPRKPGREDLLDLQVNLVRAMRRLTDIFGEEFVQQAPSLRELPDCAVTFSIKEEKEQDAWKALCDAAAIAKKLRDRRERDPGFRGADAEWLPARSRRTFRIARVYEKLVVLTRLLVNPRDDEFLQSQFSEKFKENPDLLDLGDTLIEDAPRGTLRLDMMQWLGDLLEYSLVYWIPRFPTTNELAFELGLAVPSGPPRRPELAQAAQALEAQRIDVGQEIAEHMRYCEMGMQDPRNVDPRYRSFYVAIAVALCDQWEHYKTNIASPGSARPLTGTDVFRAQAKGQADRVDMTQVATAERWQRVAYMPIVATTNYDSGLELILAEFGIPYHVVFPVQSGRNAENNSVGQWIFRTVVPGRKVPDRRMYSTDSEPPEALQGPVIVKLHGAPTQDRAEDGHGGYLNHQIVVSEKEYLVALQEVSSSLSWFETEMFKPIDDDARAGSRPRSIWFLGYSIADWNVRLRLYSHLRSNKRQLLRAVNRDYDPFRQAILSDLHVDLCFGDLNKIPQAIREHYSSLYQQCSGSVRDLIDDLRGRR